MHTPLSISFFIIKFYYETAWTINFSFFATFVKLLNIFCIYRFSSSNKRLWCIFVACERILNWCVHSRHCVQRCIINCLLSYLYLYISDLTRWFKEAISRHSLPIGSLKIRFYNETSIFALLIKHRIEWQDNNAQMN